MLWIALHFPWLALDVVQQPHAPQPGPQAVVEHDRIHLADRAATALGVHPGMTLASALALSAGLRLVPRSLPAEHDALEGIAAWAGQFTPGISLQPPTGLLLEVAGSAHLFGGLDALGRQLEKGLESLGFHAAPGIAPTPLAAWLLARAGDTEPVRERSALRARLAVLPLACLELEPPRLASLRGLGLRRIGDCLRLPRAELAHRLGPDLIRLLDRALGVHPDPRPPYLPPAHFRRPLRLPAPVDNRDALLFPARRLLAELGGFLLGRGAGVQRFTLELLAEDAAPERIEVGLAAPSRAPEHLLELLRERLERHTLAAPVETLVLCAAELLPLASRDGELFGGPSVRRDPTLALLERLRARLGGEAVYGLRPRPDHRPEQAWGRTPAGGDGELPAAERPLWLLPEPRPLQVVERQPYLDGRRLTLLQGPERIESGWWDGQEVGRDYFVGENPQRERFWIYRELQREGGWFVQGVFG